MSFGEDFEFLITTAALEADKEFLERMGFEPIGEGTDAVIRLGDGAIKLALQRGDTPGTSLVVFCADPNAVRGKLEAEGIAVASQAGPAHLGPDPVLSVTDPDGQTIIFAPVTTAIGPRAGQAPGRICGTFGEMSLESADVHQTEPFWRKLGFGPTQYAPDPVKSWTSLSDGLLMISIYNKGHVPHAFDTPAITYFDEGMGGKLPKLAQRGVGFLQTLEEGPDPQNAVVQAAGGQMFFLFSG